MGHGPERPEGCLDAATVVWSVALRGAYEIRPPPASRAHLLPLSASCSLCPCLASRPSFLRLPEDVPASRRLSSFPHLPDALPSGVRTACRSLRKPHLSARGFPKHSATNAALTPSSSLLRSCFIIFFLDIYCYMMFYLSIR